MESQKADQAGAEPPVDSSAESNTPAAPPKATKATKVKATKAAPKTTAKTESVPSGGAKDGVAAEGDRLAISKRCKVAPSQVLSWKQRDDGLHVVCMDDKRCWKELLA